MKELTPAQIRNQEMLDKIDKSLKENSMFNKEKKPVVVFDSKKPVR